MSTNTFKGTKGNWEMPAIVGRNSLGKPQATIKAKRPSGLRDIVANVYGQQIPEARANAQLISCAPDMLEMLQEVSKLQSDNYGNGSETHMKLSDLSKRLNALITRATTI